MTSTLKTSHPSVHAYHVKNLKTFVRKCDKWAALCAALSAAKGTDAEPAAIAAWSKGFKSAPTKPGKYKAYDAAAMLNPSVHCRTVADLRAVLAGAV